MQLEREDVAVGTSHPLPLLVIEQATTADYVPHYSEARTSTERVIDEESETEGRYEEHEEGLAERPISGLIFASGLAQPS